MCVNYRGWTCCLSLKPAGWCWFHYLDEAGGIGLQVGLVILEVLRPAQRADR